MVIPIYTGPMVGSLPRLAIIGAGHMAGAILAGLLRQGFPLERVRATTATARTDASDEGHGVEYRSLDQDAGANRWAVEDADIVLIGVKPHFVLGVLGDIAPVAPAHAVMVSVAAGVTIGQMEALWPGAVIRTMPNTPAEIGKGVTGVALGARATDQDRDLVSSMLGTVGDVLVVHEDSLNALSAISGSGPAYVYFFMERFLDVARSHGFSDEEAKTMVMGTFRGAVELLDQSGISPATLRERVTSPGGSTAAALAVFADADLALIIQQATDHAIARARELAGD
jgi:pyrroline-5-carboxylate reductase